MALDKMQIKGGIPLKGEIPISGAKNATLPLLAMTLLTSKPCQLRNVPNLKDVESMVNILNALGVQTQSKNSVIDVQAKDVLQTEAPYDFVRKMRASILILGPLLARYGKARVSMPGGCAIGVRPIDLHLRAFEALGAQIDLQDGYVEAKASKLRGATHRFEYVTVTGTINALMAASLAQGESTFHNCALEPEVTACARALEKMGIPMKGIGTRTLHVQGKKDMNGMVIDMIPDRIETGTYLVAGAITQGDLFLRGASSSDLKVVIEKIRNTGSEVLEDQAGIRIRGKQPIAPTNIETAEFPGFPTDMQAQLMTLLCLSKGKSVIKENIFENRFMHVSELTRMGADLQVKGSEVFVNGVKRLQGAPVMATDLRASASLILAGLAADGVTEVLRIYHLDRGYERMESKLKAVGANIQRVYEPTRG